MKTKILLATAVAAIAGALSAATSTPAGWTDDFEAAQKQAAAENKLLLVDFSGSDWCGWCKKLDREVFAKPEFVDGAKKDFVLVMVDSPRDKTRLSEKAAEQNPKLVKKYQVHGYPTVLILDAEGTVLDKTGYRAGGPGKYLEHLAGIKKDALTLLVLKRDIAGLPKNNPERLAKIDAAFADAGNATLAKNVDLIKELLENDPHGKYAAKYAYVKYRLPLEDKCNAVMAEHGKRFSKRFAEVIRKDKSRAGENRDGEQIKKLRREQMNQLGSELSGCLLEALRKLLAEATQEQATVPEYAKKEYAAFIEQLELRIKDIEARDKKSAKTK